MGYLEYPEEIKERGFGWSVSVPFLCEIISGDLKTNDDAYEARIFSQLPEKMVREHKSFLIQHWPEILSSG